MKSAFLIIYLLISGQSGQGTEPPVESVPPLIEESSQKESLPSVFEVDSEEGESLFEPEISVEKDTEIIEIDVEKLAYEKNEAGLKMLKQKKIPEALALFQSAVSLFAESAEIANNLGYAYFLVGSYEEAEKYYNMAIEIDPTRVVAILNLADMLAQEAATNIEAGKKAARLLVHAREIEGNSHRIFLRQARLEVLLGDMAGAERFYREYLNIRKPSDNLKLELGDFYRDMGRTDEAIGWYRAIVKPVFKKRAKDRIWNIEVQAQSVNFGWSARKIPLKAKALADNALALFKRHRYVNSEKLYKQSLALAPTYAGAMKGYGDLLYRTGRREKAELYYLRGLAIGSDDPEIYFRLARMYMSFRGTRQASGAVIFLRRALELRPQWSDLELDLALALRQTGDVTEALVHVKKYLAASGNDSRKRKRALRLKHSIEMLVSPADMVNSGSSTDDFGSDEAGMSRELVTALQQAKAHLGNGELDSAMAILHSIPDENRNVPVLNFEARILLGAGRIEQAVKVLELSLMQNEKQPIIHEQLGLANINLGNRAKARLHFERAQQLGDLDAIYLLANLKVGNYKDTPFMVFSDLGRVPELLHVLQNLDDFNSGNQHSIYRNEAHQIAAELKGRMQKVKYLAAAFGAIVVLLMLLVAVRFFGGIDLKRLIIEQPDSGIQVQRILSAVRHEVLKHNTMMLIGLVEAMEAGEDVADRMQHFKRQMIDGESGGVSARLNTYVRQLVQIGNAHKRRLNLQRKDAAVSPLLKGMALVEKNSDKMGDYAKLSNSSKRGLLRDLKLASGMLNIEGYEAVRALLDSLRILEVDAELISSIYNRCKMEPSFSGIDVHLEQLEMNVGKPGKVKVALPRAAFEDIVTNLVRNAIQSSLLYGDSATNITLGLLLKTEVDLVTGIERLLLFVKDRSHKELTAEMLRGRYIEEGLGLTADLVTLYDGTLDVVSMDDGLWVKAVVVKLPVAG